MSSTPSQVPNDEFMAELLEFKDGPDYKTMTWPDQRETLSNTFFPYNKQLTRTILRDKHVVFIGDSLVRAMYKDMVSLIQTGELCSVTDLRISNEDSFLGDKHIDFLELEANRVFRQAREFQSNRHLIQYYFTNRAMREDLEKTCLMMEAADERPDVVIVNSAIWDISRFPARLTQKKDTTKMDALLEEMSVADEYFNRVSMFLRRMRVLLPASSTVIWILMPPSSTPENTDSGFLANNQLKFNEIRMRLLDANARVAQIVREFGFDVLDFSFHFRLSNYQVFRVKDGVHFNIIATRYMNQLVLGHLSAAWQIDVEVYRKWPMKLQEKFEQKNDDRDEMYKTALEFLSNLNEEKHVNEEIQQSLRMATFEDYKLPYSERPDAINMEKLHHYLRVILMFMKFNDMTTGFARTHLKAFSSVPHELSRFSQEDIKQLGEMMEECCSDWKGYMAGLRMAHSNKRGHVEIRKAPLLPTPLVALLPPPPPPPPETLSPPGVAWTGNTSGNTSGSSRESVTDTTVSSEVSSSPMSISSTSAESSGGTPNSGMPNRIADAEPRERIPKKKARYSGPNK